SGSERAGAIRRAEPGGGVISLLRGAQVVVAAGGAGVALDEGVVAAGDVEQVDGVAVQAGDGDARGVAGQAVDPGDERRRGAGPRDGEPAAPGLVVDRD